MKIRPSKRYIVCTAAEQFDVADGDHNKMIVLDLIEKIYAGKGTGNSYDVQVQLNEEYSELISL